MYRRLQKLRHLRVLVVLATLGAGIVLTAQPATALGPFQCRDNAGVPAWTCEITFNSVVVDGLQVTEYTCTAIANQPPVATSTAVSCYLAEYPSTDPAVGDATPRSLPGPTSTWGGVTGPVPPDYWVCMQASSTYVTGSDMSQHNCSFGPV